MDRFLLASNEMSGNNDWVIVHTIEPIAHIQVLEGHTNLEGKSCYFGIHETETYTLVAEFVFTSKMHGKKEQNDEMIMKLLTRAWHWYKSYLEWEDKLHD
jgi:hypothetical protein